jgi:hypothetical protein
LIVAAGLAPVAVTLGYAALRDAGFVVGLWTALPLAAATCSLLFLGFGGRWFETASLGVAIAYAVSAFALLLPGTSVVGYFSALCLLIARQQAAVSESSS